MKKPLFFYESKLAQLNKFSKRLKKLIENKTFFKLSNKKQQQLIARVQRLRNRLTGFIPQHLKHKLAASALVLAMLGFSNANAQSFVPPVKNPFKINTNNIDRFIIPTLVDIDNDGDLDLFAGSYAYNAATYSGKGILHYFENTGNDTMPTFASAQTNPFNLDSLDGYAFIPAFVDIDNDGDFDLFAGGDGYGRIAYYQNTGTAANPNFANPIFDPFGINFPDSNVVIPAFVDIDGDGDFDAFFGGDEYGNLSFANNTGTTSSPQFAAFQLNPFGISANINSDYFFPSFADIDDDGDLDLFSADYNYAGGVYTGLINYQENTGTNTMPSFASIQSNPYGLIPDSATNYIFFPTFADLDGDADFDAIVGGVDIYGYNNPDIFYHENVLNIPPKIAPSADLNPICWHQFPLNLKLKEINSGADHENQTLVISAVSDNPSIVPNPTVVYTSPQDTATLVLNNINNQPGTANIVITIDDGFSINNITKDTFTVVVDLCLGINDDPFAKDLKIYPNPSRNDFNILINSQKDLGDLEIKISNSIGQVVYNEQVKVAGNQFLKNIQRKDFSPGIYFIELNSNGRKTTQKLIISE